MSLDLIQAHKDCSKLMPILHLPIQSGSSKILKDMNRNHNLDEYLTVITKLRKSKPNIKFSSDFIIAYPGETHEDFQMTLNLMKKIKFINSYSFLYSRRPGTPAAELEEVNNDIAKQRLIEFQKIADEIKNSYRSSLVNTISNVLIENRSKQNNRFFGRDEFSNSVIVESEDNLIGKIINVTITGYNNNTLFAKTNSNKIKNAAA